MKLLVLLLAGLGFGRAGAAPAPTVLSGHITHPQGTKVTLVYETDPLTGQPQRQVAGKLDANGNFRLEVPTLLAPTAASFQHGEETTALYLTPGDHLTLSLNPDQFDETVQYTGTGAAASNYLAQSYLKFGDHPEASPLAQAKTSTPAAFRQLADAYRQQRLAYLAGYAKTHPLTPAFRAYARQSITFEWANALLIFGGLHQVPGADPAALPATYYDFLATVRPAQDSALASHNAEFLDFVHTYAYRRLTTASPAPTDETLLAVTRQQFGNGPGRDLAAAQYLYQTLSSKGAAAVVPLLPGFRRTTRDSALVRGIRGAYSQRVAEDKARAVLAAGQVAPGFTVRDASGKVVSLADYRGKVVYLDFWASWCGPCMAEVPAGLALKKQFEGQDVVFLYVSIDDKEDSWRKSLADHPLQSANSVHTLDKGWQAPTPKAYLVNSIPAYFLIGRDGRFATTNTPRPSAGDQTVTLLNEALAKK